MGSQHRTSTIEEHAAGELAERFGIVTGTLAQFAAALGVSPDRVLAAVDAGGIHPLVDTAISKGRTDSDRPRDPELRSLAFSAHDFAILMGQLAAP